MPVQIDAIKRYASHLLLKRLEKDPGALLEPVSENFPAAMLVSDIAGFTRLTEKLTQGNPMGVVELAEVLDRYIGRLIEIINEHGGDIVKFAGDALFAIWRAPSEEQLAEMVYHSTQCALSIKKQLVNFEVKPGVVLNLRVGLGAGKLHVLHVGGIFERWEMLFAGEAMNQVNQAGKLARAGEVVISPGVRRHLDEIECGQANWESGKYKYSGCSSNFTIGRLDSPNLPSEAETALRAYVPRVILSRLDDGQDPHLADLRQVAVVFLKIKNFSFSDKTTLAEVQETMQLMQNCLYRYEGSINRFGIDDKGAVLLAAFGLPPLDHDNDALLAVLAAHELRRELSEVGKDCVVGICTGRVFCGSVGSEIRSDYTMHGSIVNMAASLMQAASSILCDSATYENSKHLVVFKELEPIMVKGRNTPEAVFEPKF